MARPSPYAVLSTAIAFGAVAGVLAWFVSGMFPGAPAGLIGGFFAGAGGVIVPLFLNRRATRHRG